VIRLAEQDDIKAIMQSVKDAVKLMNQQGNYQWDNQYPLSEHFLSDLKQSELYVYEKEGKVVGAVTISVKAHSEYHLISWSSRVDSFTIKRLVVSPSMRGTGIPDEFFKFAEKLAMEKGIHYIKTDTFSKNQSAQKLFQRNNYQLVEKRREEEKADDLCYFEKLLKN
jgi:ribosomal protein S18 acetylase RimI-like enzyme